MPFFHLAERLLALISQHGYLFAFILLFIEEAGIPLPVPGDGIMLFTGFLVRMGRLNPFLAFLALESGTLAGATVLFWIMRLGGAPLVRRYGKYVGLDEERLPKIEEWMRRRGSFGIFLGRLVPGLRIPTTIVSGLLEVPYWQFLPYMAAGSSIYILIFLGLGIALGRAAPRLTRALSGLPIVQLVLLGLAVVIIIVVIWIIVRRSLHGPR